MPKKQPLDGGHIPVRDLAIRTRSADGIARPLPAEQVGAMLTAGKPFTSRHTVVVAD